MGVLADVNNEYKPSSFRSRRADSVGEFRPGVLRFREGRGAWQSLLSRVHLQQCHFSGDMNDVIGLMFRRAYLSHFVKLGLLMMHFVFDRAQLIQARPYGDRF